MEREIQNPQMFETDPESFSQQSTLVLLVLTAALPTVTSLNQQKCVGA
jgi:hypothetical protein